MINILVLGHGAVGLSVGGYLYSSSNSNKNIRLSFLLKRNSELINNLPVLIHTTKEKITLDKDFFKSIDDSPKADVLIIAVKSYDLEKSLRSISHLLSDKTLALPILNGFENAVFVKKICPYLNVFEASLYISCERKSVDTIINYSRSPQLIVSSSEISNSSSFNYSRFSIEQLLELVTNSNINCVSTQNSYKESWKKFIVTSSINGACVFFNKDLGEVIKTDTTRKFLKSCFIEGIEVAGKYRVYFSKNEQDEMIQLIYSMPTVCIPSMLLDYRNCKQTEVEFLNGKIYNLGRAKQVFTPSNWKVLNHCKR